MWKSGGVEILSYCRVAIVLTLLSNVNVFPLFEVFAAIFKSHE